jgi:hypothetical protein
MSSRGDAEDLYCAGDCAYCWGSDGVRAMDNGESALLLKRNGLFGGGTCTAFVGSPVIAWLRPLLGPLAA